MAISDPGHCKTLLSQNPYSADPIVKTHLALASLDQMIAYCDGWASKTGLTATAVPTQKPAVISAGGKTVLAAELIQAAYLAGAQSNSKPSSIVPFTDSTAGEDGLAARKSPLGPHFPSTFVGGMHKDPLHPPSAGSRTHRDSGSGRSSNSPPSSSSSRLRR